VLFGALGRPLPDLAPLHGQRRPRAVATLAGVLGLRTEGLLFPLVGSHAEAILWMLPIAALTPIVIAFAIPETAARELEEIAPAPPAPPLRAPFAKTGEPS
jgi:hypothetical protein